MKKTQLLKASILLLLDLAFCIISCSEKNESTEIELATEKTSPFSAVQFKGNDVIVEVENEWFTFEMMDSIKCDFLLEYSKAIYGYDYKKRFSEDFVEFLLKIGITPESTEEFVLLDENQDRVRKELKFTRANRTKASEYYDQNYEMTQSLDLVLSKEQMEADLDELQYAITNYYSYAFLNKVNVKKEIQKLKDKLPDETTSKEFGILLKPFINQFGDAHSRLKALELDSYGLLPFETSAFEGKIVCHLDTQLVEEGFPFLKSVNGISVEKLKALTEYWLVSNASPQFVQRAIARNLSYMGFLLERLGKYKKSIKVEFENEKGEVRIQNLELWYLTNGGYYSSDRINSFKNKILKNNIGYLKIPDMQKGFEEQLHPIMEGFQNTKGLIIDVRDNPGGQRDILLELIPYFISPEQGRVIGNIAVLRTNLQSTPKEGFLSNRFMYPLTSSQYTEEDKDFIITSLMNFSPSVSFDEKKYSHYHYLLLKADEQKLFYDKPVVVLMNEGCFSATDIFLSSFQQLDNVTLIGTKSGGGSGRTSTLQLPNSTLEIKLSTIISFQPDGSLYDRVGVSPDTEAYELTIDDVIGKRDNQLDIALKHIHNQSAYDNYEE